MEKCSISQVLLTLGSFRSASSGDKSKAEAREKGESGERNKRTK
jgi:hypothetical protein